MGIRPKRDANKLPPQPSPVNRPAIDLWIRLRTTWREVLPIYGKKFIKRGLDYDVLWKMIEKHPAIAEDQEWLVFTQLQHLEAMELAGELS